MYLQPICCTLAFAVGFFLGFLTISWSLSSAHAARRRTERLLRKLESPDVPRHFSIITTELGPCVVCTITSGNSKFDIPVAIGRTKEHAEHLASVFNFYNHFPTIQQP